MASTYMPVETILKVDDSELLLNDNQKIESSPSVASANYVSIGTQCDWKVKPVENKVCSLLSTSESSGGKINILSPSNLGIGERNAEDMPLLIRSWPSHTDHNISSDQKLIIPAAFSQQFACNIQTLPVDEKFFLQFDYKTRNKLKTKQRRMDPYYRTQERVRQRTVMRIKRQDPRFRAAEREKGRYRMRLKRLDPVFRSQERERQRERMKLKRSNPDFREREREQQKTRLHVKRMDPAFKEKEQAQDRLRMRIKRQNNGLYSTMHSDKIKTSPRSETSDISSENQTFKEVIEPCTASELRSNQAVFPENFNARFLSIKPRESSVEAFHFKKQHILNFNFYNSSKEQWATHDDLCPKAITQFNVMGENGKLQSSVGGNNANILDKNNILVPKKSYLKNDLISPTLINNKPEDSSNVAIEKQKHVDHDTTAIPRFSLTPTSGN